MAFHPAVFFERLYAVLPIILIFGFIFSNALLYKRIILDYFKADIYATGIILALFLFLSIQYIYSPVQGFYWYNSAMYYTGFFIMAQILFTLLIDLLIWNKPVKWLKHGIIVLIFGCLIGGGNYIVALTSLAIMGLFLIYSIIRKKSVSFIIIITIGFIAIGAGLLISVTAPGNAFRQQAFEEMEVYGMSPASAIANSYIAALYSAFRLTRLSHIFIFLCLIPVVYPIVNKSEFKFSMPGLATGIFFSVYASTFTPNLFSLSSYGPPRVMNISYYVYLLCVFLTLIYWTGWVSKRKKNKFASKRDKKAKSKKQSALLAGNNAIILLLICAALSVSYDSLSNANILAGVSALRSLTTGEARTYHQEQQNRKAIYNDPSIINAEVTPFTARPYVLYFDDITDDAGDWRNVSVAETYGKESVVLVNPG